MAASNGATLALVTGCEAKCFLGLRNVAIKMGLCGYETGKKLAQEMVSLAAGCSY